MNEHTEVLIIGSGIIGCATAYYLAKMGCQVLVLESSDNIGDGGSSRNGGGVRQSGRDARELPLAIFAVENLWPKLSEELEMDCEYCQGGNLRLGKNARHMEILEDLAKKAEKCGLSISMIDGKDVRKKNPWLSEEIIGASWCPTDGHANPLVTTLAYYKKALQMGVQFITGVKVISLEKCQGRLSQVVTDQGIFRGEQVLVAAGYGSRQIVSTVGIELPIRKIPLEALVTEAQPVMFEQMLGTADADFYGHQTKHGSFIFGGSSGMEGFTKTWADNRTSSYTAPCITRGILKYVPMLTDAKVIRTWAGSMDECVDGIPILGKVDEVPGLILACGFTGHGFGIAPAVGLIMAELITGKETSLNLQQFKYNRFHTKG